jgi:hypothetical protein
MKRFFARPVILLLAIANLVLTQEFSNAKADDKLEPGFVSLFDGKTLDGWEGNTKLWSVENGAIVGEIDGKEKSTKGNTFLIWKGGDVADFELRLQFKIVGNNSGIQYRSKIVNKRDFVIGGYQADFEVGEKYSGINYEEKGRGILAERGERVTIDEKGKKHQGEKIGDPAELGKKIKRGEWNDYTIIAFGNKLQHFINGQLMCEVIDDQKEKSARAELSLEYKIDTRALSGLLALQLHAGPPMKVEFKNIRLKDLRPRGTRQTSVETLSKDESGFKQLFNGKSLDGWEGNPDLWRVEDGCIVGETTKEKKIRNNTFLVWKDGKPGDFDLRFQYKLRNHNTGIQYRSTVIDDKKWIVRGYQCDLVVEADSVGGVEDYTGLCWYEAGDRGVLGFRSQRTTIDKDGFIIQREKIDNKEKLAKLVKIGDWNDVAIVCNGSKIQQFINGQLMCEVLDEQVDRRVLEGVLALQLHVGPPMKVEFKNIRLKNLKANAAK